MKLTTTSLRVPALFTTALFFACSLPGAAQSKAPTVSLASLEAQVQNAPGIQADQIAIQAARQNVDVMKAKAGMKYLYQNTLGPRAVIVPRSYDYHVVRYEQSAGVVVPLFGTRLTEQLAILDAQQQQQLATIALAQAKRERLASLREAYVMFWQYANQSAIATNFVQTAKGTLQQAQILEKTGFWTHTQFLDLVNGINKVSSSAQNYHSSQIAQFAQIQEAVGSEIPQFEPQTPEYFDECAPSRGVALASAFRADPVLAQLDAQAGVIHTKLKSVKYASIDATASLTVGSSTDVNYRVSGYNAVAALNLSAPRHGRAEERDLRAMYDSQLKAIALQQTERRNAITAAVDAALLNIQNAQTTLTQSVANVQTSQRNLDKALVRYNTIHVGAAKGFSDLQTPRYELYGGQIAESEARAQVLLQANQLLLLAPDACGTRTAAAPSITAM